MKNLLKMTYVVLGVSNIGIAQSNLAYVHIVCFILVRSGRRYKSVITSIWEILFYPAFVCLSVLLFVCLSVCLFVCLSVSNFSLKTTD